MKYIAKNVTASEMMESAIIAVFENGELSKTAKEFDEKSQGYLTQLIQEKEITGKLGQVVVLRNLPNVQVKRLFVVGAGKAEEGLTVRQLKTLWTNAIKAVKETVTASVVSFLDEVKVQDRDLNWNLRFAVETIENSDYIFDQCKSKKEEHNKTLHDIIFNVAENQITSATLALTQAEAIAYGVKIAKDAANLPPNICTPAYLAQQAIKLSEESPFISTEIIGEDQMHELGMTSYLAVSQGSVHEAQMSIIKYTNNPDKNAKPIVLVGKGLTFDAGGISLKPGAGMDEMKYDMCGAASVLGTMNALVKLGLPINVIGVLAGCENLPDGEAYRPGDIINTMEGLTVEVLNTDAEGRLVLCDALTYVKRFDPALVVDIATLTGACVVALGHHNSGLMATNEELAANLLTAADQTQDKAWRLPLGEEYDEQLKSNFADLANIGGRFGGSSTAGAFLSHFTKQYYPWAHLDIAGTAWLQGAAKGATGRPVGLLTQFLINQVEK